MTYFYQKHACKNYITNVTKNLKLKILHPCRNPVFKLTQTERTKELLAAEVLYMSPCSGTALSQETMNPTMLPFKLCIVVV